MTLPQLAAWMDAQTKGRKTLVAGAFLIAYLGIESYAGRTPDPAVVNIALAAMGLSLRDSVRQKASPGSLPS